MPRKRLGSESGPRDVADCHVPLSVTGPTGASIEIVSPSGARAAVAGQSYRQLYKPNTCLPWNQIAVRAESNLFYSAANCQFSATGPVPAGSLALFVSATEPLSSHCVGEVRIVAGQQFTRPTVTRPRVGGFPWSQDFLSWPARYWPESNESVAQAESTASDTDYCTEPFPSHTRFLLPGGVVSFYETQIHVGDSASPVEFVDALWNGAGYCAASASIGCGNDPGVVSMHVNGGDGDGAIKLLDFRTFGRGFYFKDRAPRWFPDVYGTPAYGYTSQPVGVVQTISVPLREPGAFVGNPVSYDAPISGYSFQAWRNGVPVSTAGVTVSTPGASEFSIDVSSITQQDGSYRFRIHSLQFPQRMAGGNNTFNVSVGAEGTDAAPIKNQPLDYAIELGWVQDFTSPSIAVSCVPSATTQSPTELTLVSTEPLAALFTSPFATGATVSRNGAPVSAAVSFGRGNDTTHRVSVSYLLPPSPGKYRIDFGELQARDLAGNTASFINPVEWTHYAVATGPSGPLPIPVAGSLPQFSEPVTGPVASLPLTFTSPVTGVSAAAVSLLRDGSPQSLPLLSVTGTGSQYTINGLASAHQAGKAFLLSCNTTAIVPLATGYSSVAGPVQAAWVTATTGPASLPELDTASRLLANSGLALLGGEYAIVVTGPTGVSGPTGAATGASGPSGPSDLPRIGWQSSVPTGAQWAIGLAGSPVVSCASVTGSLQFVTGTRSPAAVFQPPSANAVLGPASLGHGRIYNDPTKTLSPQDSASLGHGIALHRNHRHALWTLDKEATEIEVEIIAEDFRQHPHYVEGAEIWQPYFTDNDDVLADYWAFGAIAGTYTLGNEINGKQLVPCQYYYGGEGQASFPINQEPPYVPKCWEIEQTGEFSLDEDWVPLYEKANPDDPNNVTIGSNGIYVGWNTWPLNSGQPVGDVPLYLSSQKLTAANASFSDDPEESREFAELVSLTSGPLPGSSDEEIAEWGESQMGMLSSFRDTRVTGTAKTWTVSADNFQIWARVAREVPLAVSRCGTVNGKPGCVRVYLRMRAMYTIAVNPVREWGIKWRVRNLVTFVAQDREQSPGIVLDTTYWILQGRRIFVDNVAQRQSRTLKRERFFEMDFLLSPEEASALEAGQDVTRRIEFVHNPPVFDFEQFEGSPAPQFVEFRLRLPPAAPTGPDVP